MKLPSAIACASALLAGCASVPGPDPAGVTGEWSQQISATAGSSLTLSSAGQDVLRLACRRNPTDLYLASDRLPAAKGPVRLQIGSHSFTMSPSGEEPRLAATSTVPAALPAALMSGAPIEVSAGGRTLGPLPAPEAKTAAAFAIACGGPAS
jgi:hypothetical protein